MSGNFEPDKHILNQRTAPLQSALSSDIAFITLTQIQQDLNQFTQALIDITGNLRNLSKTCGITGDDVKGIPHLIDNCEKINAQLIDIKMMINSYNIAITKATSERQAIKTCLDDVKNMLTNHVNLLHDITKGASEHNQAVNRSNLSIEQNVSQIEDRLNQWNALPSDIKEIKVTHEKLDRRIYKFLVILAAAQTLALTLYGLLTHH